MDRRFFLQHLVVGAAAGAAPAWLRAETLVPEREPWLAGFRTIGKESIPRTAARVEGRWPSSLAGTLYRNGPAWFDRAGVRYQHWFDGDGMIRAWYIGGGKVAHAARMVATSKFQHEQRVGRFEVPAAGTQIASPLPIRNNDDVNTANTSVIRIGGRVFALWEGGSAYEIDPDSLATRGPMEWREDLIAAPFSAHPLTDVDGSVWNFGSLSFFGSNGVLIWHIGADGKLRRSHILKSSTPGYLHAFAMTPRYLVFMLMPFEARTGDQAFFEQLRFLTNQPCRIALVPKDALDAPRWFEVDFAAAYHFADAYESQDRVIMRVVRHRDAEEARSPMAAAMRGEVPPKGNATDLASVHLDLATGRAHWESHDIEGVEFPAFDARTPGTQGSPVFAPLRVEPSQAPYFNAIGRFDIERGRRDVYRYGTTVLAEEHLFVPKPGGQRAGEGWLLGTWHDYNRNRGGVSLFDAEHVSHGPIASAWVPFTTPLGFHGWFAPQT